MFIISNTVAEVAHVVTRARIKGLREAKGWSRNKLAQLAGVSQGYLSDLENGNIPSPSGQALAKLAEHLNTSTDYLLGRTDDPTPPSQQGFRVERNYPTPPPGYEDLTPEEREHIDRITREFEEQTIALLKKEREMRKK